EIPARALDRVDVAQDLLVVANRVEGARLVLRRALLGASGNELAGSRAEALDLVLPLGLERCRTDHEDALDAAFSCQKLGHADGLDRLSEAHVVGENGAA